jgi:hypothetical protein
MTSEVDAYRARAAEYDRKAETMGKGNAAIQAYYQRLAQHWRSLALLAEDKSIACTPLPRWRADTPPATR